MSESYVLDRHFVRFVVDACKRQGIEHRFFSDDWIAVLSRGAAERRIFGYNFDINLAAATAFASDKVAAYQLLAARDVPAIEHFLLRSRATEDIRRDNVALIRDDMPVVIKPLAGTSGHGVHFCQCKQEAFEHVESQTRSDWALSPYYEIISEKRLVLLDDEVLLGYEKQVDEHDGFVQFNLSKGAKPVVCTPSAKEEKIAKAAQQALGLRLAVVDLAMTKDGRLLVVEVNTGLMMEYFARQSEEYYDMAQGVYDKIIETMMQ